MKNSLFKAMGVVVFFLLFLSAFLTSEGMAQSVTKVKATISATESGTQCKVEYTLKNGNSPLKELAASTILFQDTKVSNVKAILTIGVSFMTSPPPPRGPSPFF